MHTSCRLPMSAAVRSPALPPALVRVLTAIAVLVAVAASPTADAASIRLTPSSVVTTNGTTVIVDVGVSALGPGVALGTFDLDLAFDPTLLAPASVVFGPSLGSPAAFEAFTSSSFAAPGVVDFAELSLLPSAQLLALQSPAGFSIATLTFNAIAPGTAAFTVLASSLLGDAFGNAIPIAQPTAIDEPASVALLGFGVAGLAWLGRRGGRRGRSAVPPRDDR